MSTTEAHTEVPVFDAAFVQDLHSRYAEIRDATPVQRMATPHGLPVWVITRYEDVRAALTDPRLRKEVTRIQEVIAANLLPDSGGREFEDSLASHMLNMDPPDHTRLRKLVVKAFTSRRVEALRPRVEEITERLLDDMADRSEVDLLDSFAFPLPIQVISELLGVDESRRDAFRAWTNVLLDASDREAAGAAAAEMAQYLAELIEIKRREPGDDLVTALVDATEDQDRLSDKELIAMVFLLLVAGHETTVNLIGNGVLHLLRHPDQWAALRADPELVTGAVEEMLRFDGPVMHGTFRFTAEPMTIGGVEIPAGQIVWVGLAAANRDPEQFPEPDRFDITRDAHGHVAFGHGIHFCLGAQLARLEAHTALRGLIQRFPNLTAAGPLDDVQWRFSTLIHGLRAFPVHPAGR
ncbi:Cytochrome P450 [Saccharopolyspora antimicrobica]|uniref:Cytochrome P450 n=1 Tax=Saccharopolyspora antimicrobica TaxID=455193 RepID=A0A1I4V4L1_9PSEU|nr:cytochrome P450 [Saccharopolyspora antimicrobica]RKT86122.1 cytochrome P450 [Saccharopolyspora antimicrobica]SFM96105.1 Cytochrome P450 [Saccharopolyspora antimicrobica]